MKTLIITLLLSATVFAQEADTLTQDIKPRTEPVKTVVFVKDTLKTRAFRFTPLPASTNKVNGMTLGIGLGIFDDRPVTVNGFNLELNPLAPFAILGTKPNPDRKNNTALEATVNGLNVSLTGFRGNACINGMGISPINVGLESNGFFLSGLYHSSRKMDGLFISGIGNWCVKGEGLHLAFINSAQDFKGVTLGGINEADYFKGITVSAFNFSYREMNGLQIGLYNEAKKCRGLQIGLWNVNEKRSLPIVNWNFRRSG